MRTRSGRTAVATAAVALVLSACGGSSGPTAGNAARERPTSTAPAGAVPSDPATPTTAAGPAPAVPAAFEFSAPALGGGRVVGADYADTGVALWFWAPW